MRRTIHWDFDNYRHSCWVSCIVEVEITPNERDQISRRTYEVSGHVEIIDVSVMAFEGYDEGGQQVYCHHRGAFTPEWLETLDRVVESLLQDDLDNNGTFSDELWSYA